LTGREEMLRPTHLRFPSPSAGRGEGGNLFHLIVKRQGNFIVPEEGG
jgi:hypothetical protein